MNATARAAVGQLSGAGARKRARRLAGLPAYADGIVTTRGHCRAKGCASRLGITRVTVDTTARDAVVRSAHVECAQCQRVWYRVKGDTPATTANAYQRVLFDLIAPSGDKRVLYRVKTNGAWHVNGDDSVTIANASRGQVSDALHVWRAARDKREAAKARAKARKAETDLIVRLAGMAALARMDERNAEREAEERAAEERERKGMA